MESYFVLADLAARSRLADTAFSALPDAPVQPVRSRRSSGVGRLVARARFAARHRVAAPPKRRARPECATTA